MSSTNQPLHIPHKRPFSEKLKVSLRKRWYGPRRPPGARQVVRCRYFNADFIVDLEDVVGYEIAINRFEWRELKMMLDACRRLRPQVFFDVGANLGLYSCVLAKSNAVPRIVAYEPDRDNHARMLANLELNGVAGRVELHACAVGAAAGTAQLVPAGSSNRGLSRLESGAAGEAYPVPVVSLDEVARLDGATLILKVDVEGYELEVLMGAAQLLTRNRGYAQIEGRTDRIAGVIRELMATFGWRFVEHYGIDLRFEKP